MVTAFQKLNGAAGTYKVNIRVGAYIVAINSLAEAMRIRGMY